jgi:hypothetical protein
MKTKSKLPLRALRALYISGTTIQLGRWTVALAVLSGRRVTYSGTAKGLPKMGGVLPIKTKRQRAATAAQITELCGWQKRRAVAALAGLLSVLRHPSGK